MTEVMFHFDTEDYIAPFSDDAILRLADILHEEGVKGSFNMVGELSRVLTERNRLDIIQALKNHEINYHTYKHTWHPTISEYTDTEDWFGAYNRFKEIESQGIDLVKKTFDVDKLWAFVPPGGRTSSQANHGYVDLGIPMFNSTLFKGSKGKGIWYCNAFNLEMNFNLEETLLNEGVGGLKKCLEQWYEWDRVILCIHPNMVHYSQFWDELNMKGENLVPWGEWMIPEQREDSVIEKFYADFRETIRTLKHNGHFKFVTNQDIWKEQQHNFHREISKSLLIKLLGAVRESFFYQETEQQSFSLADMFQASIHYLSNEQEIYTTDNVIGPLYEPEGVKETVQLKAKDVVDAAKRMKGNHITPHSIQVGNICIGPGDFLRAAHQLFEGQEKVIIAPGPQLPDIQNQNFFKLDDYVLLNTWMLSESFEDNWGTKRMKLQSWTIRSEMKPK
jgi:hypothetical protein